MRLVAFIASLGLVDDDLPSGELRRLMTALAMERRDDLGRHERMAIEALRRSRRRSDVERSRFEVAIAATIARHHVEISDVDEVASAATKIVLEMNAVSLPGSELAPGFGNSNGFVGFFEKIARLDELAGLHGTKAQKSDAQSEPEQLSRHRAPAK